MDWDLEEQLSEAWGDSERVDALYREVRRRHLHQELAGLFWKRGELDQLTDLLESGEMRSLFGRPRHILRYLLSLVRGDIDGAHEALQSLWPTFLAASEREILKANPVRTDSLLCPLCLSNRFSVIFDQAACSVCGLTIIPDNPFRAPSRDHYRSALQKSFEVDWCFFCVRIPDRISIDGETHSIRCPDCLRIVNCDVWDLKGTQGFIYDPYASSQLHDPRLGKTAIFPTEKHGDERR